MNIALIVNSAAGSIDPEQREETSGEALKKQLEKGGATVELHAVDGPKIKAEAEKIVKSGADLIVAAGGDGTVSAAACGILDSGRQDVKLGVLPLGTLNHFAKDNNIPTDLKDAITNIGSGRVVQVDAAEVNGYGFINNSSIGLYPHSVRERDEQQTVLGRGKWPAMAVAMMNVFKRFPLYHVRLDVDGKKISHVTPFVFIGNNAYKVDIFSLGGREELDRGVISLYMAKCSNRISIIKHAFLALVGRLEQARDFETLTASEITIETHRKKISVSLDGEVVVLEPPLVYKSRPRALNVIVPQQT